MPFVSERSRRINTSFQASTETGAEALLFTARTVLRLLSAFQEGPLSERPTRDP